MPRTSKDVVESESDDEAGDGGVYAGDVGVDEREISANQCFKL
jgi:hypothetical protein